MRQTNGTHSMAEKTDLDDLAKRYLDLWQEQLNDLSQDKEVAEAVAKSIELMNGSAATFARMAEQNIKNFGGLGDDAANRSLVATKSGTAPDGAASGNADDVVGELTRRIGELEQRVAELESASKTKSPRPRKRS